MDLAKAILYSAKRSTALTRYPDDGGIEIDNSAAERGLRCVALGRNNFLFADSMPMASAPQPCTASSVWLAQRFRALRDKVRHPEHEQFSTAETLEHERPQVMLMPVPLDGYVEKPARVPSACLVSTARKFMMSWVRLSASSPSTGRSTYF